MTERSNVGIMFVRQGYGSVRSMLFQPTVYTNHEDIIYLEHPNFFYVHSMHLIYNHLCTNQVELITDFFANHQIKYDINLTLTSNLNVYFWTIADTINII